MCAFRPSAFWCLQEVFVASIAQEDSLFEINRELDLLLDEIEEEIGNRVETWADLDFSSSARAMAKRRTGSGASCA